jgi:two-component system response regulator DevR
MVMIGMDADEQSFLEAVRQGAVGYVLKDASVIDVISAVRSVANGEAVCPPKLCIYLFRYVFHQSSHLPSFQVNLAPGLTNREQQLVLLIGRGLTNKEIASQLQLAEQTVRNHVHRMIRKVGVTNRLAVVEACRVQGLPV